MHHIAILGGLIALAVVSFSGIVLTIATARFFLTPPYPPAEFTPEVPFPGPAIQAQPQRERFHDADCRTDFDVMMEARKLHATHVERAKMKERN